MLNNRLAAIAKYITPNTNVVDVGTDHALLPIFLIQNTISSKVVGVELNREPYLKAKNKVAALGLDRYIDLRLGYGLEPVQNDQVNIIVIAGMGAKTIIEILKRGAGLIKKVDRIILQPMNGCELIRTYLHHNRNLAIVDEDIVMENGRLYEIIVAEHGVSRDFDDILIEIGSILFKKKHPLFPILLEKKIQRYKKIADNLDKSNKLTSKNRIKYYESKAKSLEKVLISCL